MPVAVAVAALLAILALARRRRAAVSRAVLVDPPEATTIDARGAVRSVQAAELVLRSDPATPGGLERLERAYWRTVTRATLGLVRLRLRPHGHELVLLAPPVTLMAFGPARRELGDGRGEVRWPIERGLLVAAEGRHREGALRIAVRRHGEDAAGGVRARVEVEVSRFHPMLAARVARWLYRATQARVHVLVTHAFLRSLTA